MCATRTQRTFWICFFCWLLMVPVIVVPIVLTTQTVTLKMGSAVVTCTPRLTPNAGCCVVADRTKGPTATGAPVNVTLVVHNPNYRSATAKFTIFVNGTLRAVSATSGWLSQTITLSPKADTTVTLAVPVYFSETDSPIDPFIYAQVCDYGCTTNCNTVSQASSATFYGSMGSQVGSISTQNLNFNYVYNFSAGS